MKRLWGIIVFVCMAGHPSVAQFDYFNQIGGAISDTLIDVMSNVELVGDTIYTYGIYGDDSNGMSIHLQKYDLQGEFVSESKFAYGAGRMVFVETTSSFVQDQQAQHFYYSNAVSDSLGMRGMVGKVSLTLDTLWVHEYDHYHPHTYFKRNLDVGDGVVLVGEIEAQQGNQSGTMLSKIDYEGELIWDTVLRPANGDINRNNSILQEDGLLLLGGSVLSDGQRLGLITKTDLQGGILWEHFFDDSGQTIGPYSGSYIIGRSGSDDIVSAIYIHYSPAGGSPSNWYGKVVLSKVDLENETVYWEHEYLTDFESRNGGVIKVLPTSDGGMAILGGDYSPELIGWILKIDSLGELEWQKYYAYESGYQHFNQVYDFEICPDGGYLIVGSYSDWNTGSSLPRSWMVKTDPCGDVEWNGCLPVGLGEMEMRRRVEVSIYPNPATDYCVIESQGETFKRAILTVVDVLGRIRHREAIKGASSVVLDTRSLLPGIYQVLLIHDGGVIASKSLEILR